MECNIININGEKEIREMNMAEINLNLCLPDINAEATAYIYDAYGKAAYTGEECFIGYSSN